MARQNLAIDAIRHQNACVDLGYPAWLSARDVTIPARGRRQAFTIRRMLTAARAAGVCPHSGDDDDDEVFAAVLWNAGTALRRKLIATKRAAKAGAGVPVNLANLPGVGEQEESVVPDARLGTAEGEYPRTNSVFGTSPFDMQTQVREEFGTTINMLADLYAVGCGRARRVLQSDIYWGDLFPSGLVSEATDHNFYDDGAKVLAPGDMLAAIRANDFRRLAATSSMVFSSWLLAQIAGFDPALKIDLTPFSRAGGNNLNLNWTTGKAATPTGMTADQCTAIQTGAPSWKNGVLIPSSDGWDEFYYNFDGYAEQPLDVQTYQQYAVHLFPTETAEDMAIFGLGPAPAEGADADQVAMDDYQRECARRKSLGIAAFAQGIGEWLVAFDAAFATVGASIYDVVDIIELGNELEVFYRYYRADKPDDVQPSDDVETWGAMEAARYMALIGGPIRALLPSMQFRVSEIAVWHGDGDADDFSGKVDWLQDAILLMDHEVVRWQSMFLLEFLDGWVDVPWVEDWGQSATDAGFEWPPSDSAITFDSSDLTHFAGFHWYHGYDRGEDYVTDYSAYADAIRQQADVDLFRRSISDPFGLKLSVGENGFPAVDPFAISDVSSVGDRVYYHTNAQFQAGMLLRTLATHLACGVDRCSWFTFAFGPSKRDPGASTDWINWAAVSTSGLHNDVENEDGTYTQHADCWQRPAWFTLRRLIWLLQAGGGAQLYMTVNSKGITVIELAFPAGLASGPNGDRYQTTWARGYLCWLDQYASNPDVHPDSATLGPDTVMLLFSDPSGDGFTYLPVVPEVASSGLTRDANGYPRATLADGTLSWTWKGAHDAVIARSSTTTTFSLELQKADPDAAPVPIFLLTNASFSGYAYGVVS